MPIVIRLLAAAAAIATAIANPVPMQHRHQTPDPDPAGRAAVTVIGANSTQAAAVEEALQRFAQAGLALPPLVIEYAATTDACRGHAGLYSPAPNGHSPTDRITMCSSLRLFLLHELAHAWGYHSLTDDTRRSFMDRWALQRWNDHNDSWYDRGTEKAAHTIAYTLALDAPTDDPDILRFVCGYELLTGNPIPVEAGASCHPGTN